MIDIPEILSTKSGAARNANAIFVKGPVGTNHKPGFARTVSIIKKTALAPSAGRDGSGKFAPSMPLSP